MNLKLKETKTEEFHIYETVDVEFRDTPLLNIKEERVYDLGLSARRYKDDRGLSYSQDDKRIKVLIELVRFINKLDSSQSNNELTLEDLKALNAIDRKSLVKVIKSELVKSKLRK